MPKERNTTLVNQVVRRCCGGLDDAKRSKPSVGGSKTLCRLAAISLTYKLTKICPLVFYMFLYGFSLFSPSTWFIRRVPQRMYVITNDTFSWNGFLCSTVFDLTVFLQVINMYIYHCHAVVVRNNFCTQLLRLLIESMVELVIHRWGFFGAILPFVTFIHLAFGTCTHRREHTLTSVLDANKEGEGQNELWLCWRYRNTSIS